MAGRLVTGTADFDSNQWSLGRRVFFRDFDSDFAINNPGFNALGSAAPNLPEGSQALPGNEPLSWDFLPMMIDDDSRNLFYWNGLESDDVPGLSPDDVAFGPPPGPNYLLSLFDKSNAKHSVNGADAVVPGGVIDDTASDGSLHRHRFFFLENGDASGASTPEDGIYLVAMRLRMVGLLNSLPIYMVFGTPGSEVAALDNAAVPWVEDRVDELIPIGLPGDYNQDDIVDVADYTVWRNSLGTAIALPNEGASPNLVDQEDYAVWKMHYGEAITNDAAISDSKAVPEPTAAFVTLTAMIWLASTSVRQCQRGEPHCRKRH
jgi:hypothetical protein